MASLQLKSNETFYYSNVSNAGEGPTSGAGAPKGEESSERKDVEMKFHSDKHVWCFYNDMYKKMEVCGFSPSGKTYTLKRKGETLENVPAEKVTPCLKEHIQLDSENNIDIIQLNEPNVIENLQNRYAKNKIYTFHASLLLAINPYKQIPGLYGEESMHRYLSKFGKGSGRGSESGSSGAHIYDIGNLAYKNMVLKGKRQTIVVSGHSGSGKTENCKILFKYFHYMFFHRSGVAAAAEAAAEGGEAGVAAAAAGGDATGQRIDKLIYINSIIEAMSNAKTIKNNNSSRCGRINELLFEERRRRRTDETIFNHCFTNMKIRILLLEINRCIRHNKGERNFHVFYEIVRGLTDAELSQRGLVRDVHRYRLLRCADHGEDIPTGESALEEERKDQKNFHHLMDGLRYIQYDEGRISQFVDVVAGVIHLGEIDPGGEGQEEGAGEEEGVGGEESNLGGSPNADSYQNACSCLGLPLAELQSTIRFKSIHVSGERIRTQRSRDNAMNTLHSLIKVIYKNLFCKLVGDINRTHLSGEESEEVMNESAQVRSNHTISILDLYGFEELASNDFEQLCINLANEKLNNYYILNEVEKEKLIHREENILWREVPIPNYKDTILFVEKLFLSLDDITKLNSCGQKKVDEDFFSYLLQSERSYLEKGTYGFVSSRDGSYTDRRHGVRRNVFFVRHYAGCVAYTVSGWIGKNSDRVEAEIGELIARSGNWFLGGEATVGGGGTMEVSGGSAVVGGCSTEATASPLRGDANYFLASARGVPTQESSPPTCNKNILSVSKKYIKELDKLFSNMKETDLHYIRCILPNEQMRRDNLKRRLIYTQLKQCGAIEMVKIVNRGLSHKVLKGEFLNRCRRDVPKELQHCRDDDIAYYFMRLFDEANSFKVGKNYIFMGSGVYTEVHGYLYGDHLHQMGRHHLPLMEERKKKILKEINTRRFRRSVWVVQIHNWLSTHYRTYLQKKKRMKEKACDYMFKVYLIFKTVMGVKRSLGYNVGRLQRVLARKAYGGFFRRVQMRARARALRRGNHTKWGKRPKGGTQVGVEEGTKEDAQVGVEEGTKEDAQVGVEEGTKEGTQVGVEEGTKEGTQVGVAGGLVQKGSPPPCDGTTANGLSHTAAEIFVATPDHHHHVYSSIDWVVVFREKQVHLYRVAYAFERVCKQYLPDFGAVTLRKRLLPCGGDPPPAQLGTHTYMPLPIHCIGQHPLYKNIFIAVEGDLSVRIFSYPTLDSIKRFLRRKIHLMKRGSGDIPSTYLPQLHRSRRFGGPSGGASTMGATAGESQPGDLFSEDNLNMFMHMYKDVYVLSSLGKVAGGAEVVDRGTEVVDGGAEVVDGGAEVVDGRTARNNPGECALLRRIHKEEYIEQEVCANPSFKILKVAFLPTSLSHFVCLSYEQRGREHYLLVTLVNCCSKPTYNYTTKIRITSVIESAQFWKFLLQTGGDSLAGATEPVAVGRRCPGDQNEEKKKHVESYLSTLQISPISNSLVVIHGACLLSLVQIHHYSLGSSDVCLREYERRFLRVAFSLICFEVFSHVCEEHLGRLSPDLKHRLVVDELFGRGEKRSNIEEGSNIEERSNTQICLNGSGDSDTSAHLAGPLDEVKKQPDEATPQEPPRQCSLYAFSPRGEIYLLTNGERGGSSGELFRHGPWGVRKLAVRRRSAGEGAAWEGATGEKATEEGATEEGATEEGATGEGATGEGATGGLPPPCSYYGVFSMNISHFYKQEYHKSFVTLRPSIQATIRKYARAGREPVTGVSGSSRIRSGINSMSSRMSKSLFPDVCVLREWTGSGFEGVQRECLYYSLRNGGEAMTLCRGEGRPSPPPDSTNDPTYSTHACSPLGHLDTLLLLRRDHRDGSYALEFFNVVSGKGRVVPLE
ncbi:myosin J, putative [Plasmodium vivax]|uniref:Myosin J, putative n=1 Tax=Plasmodium vivax TaxID=5855 RepID=A0A565A2P0_PLAVI|nr:myosin J, putative [Plasmodium vivax]